jgi:hypothetical protein
MGLTTTVLTSKAIQANEGQDPGARDHGHRLHDQQDNRRPRSSYLLLYDAPHVATWAQDHDDNHVRTHADTKTRRPSLQAKIASFFSLRLTTARSGEPNPLYVAWPRTLYKGTHGTLPREGLSRFHSGSLSPLSYLFHSSCISHCKNFRAFNREIRTRSISETGHRAPV